MAMRKIPSNHKYFEFTQVNPKDRRTTDCVIRSIALIEGRPWEEILREMTEFGIKLGYIFNDKPCIEKYLATKGYIKLPAPVRKDNSRYTGREFLKDHPNRNFDIIMKIGGHHITACRNGKICDTWDSSLGAVCNYWVKEQPGIYTEKIY